MESIENTHGNIFFDCWCDRHWMQYFGAEIGQFRCFFKGDFRKNDGVRNDGDFLRYGFPTLDLKGPRGRAVLSGWHTIDEYRQALRAVGPGGDHASFQRQPIAELLNRFGTLTGPEIELLSVETGPPEGSFLRPSANGPLLVDGPEAQRRGWGSKRPFAATCPK